jgi:hypothetical protein
VVDFREQESQDQTPASRATDRLSQANWGTKQY